MEPGASPKLFSIKFTPDSHYFPWERWASPAFYNDTLRPQIKVVYSQTMTIPLPDLTVYNSFIETDPVWPKLATTADLKAQVRNTGARYAEKVDVYFYDGNPDDGGVLLGKDEIDFIGGGGLSEEASIKIVVTPGRHDIYAVADPEEEILETDELNNTGVNTIPFRDGYQSHFEGFEFGFGDWLYDFDTPKEYQTGRNRLSFMHPTKEEAYKSKQSIFAYLDGRGDDGTIWLERGIPVPKNKAIRIDFSFAFGLKADLATTLMYFIEFYDPEVEVDFHEAGVADGWNVYTFTTSLWTGENNRLWLGGGYTARWETELRKYLDDFRVKITVLY